MTGAGERELLRAIEAGGVLDAVRAAVQLRRAERGGLRPLLRLAEEGDTLARTASAYVLGRRAGVAADRALLSLLEAEDVGLREAASLAFAERTLWPPALPALSRVAAAGGFSAMVAELALEEWCRQAPDLVGHLLRPEVGHRGVAQRPDCLPENSDEKLDESPPPAAAGTPRGIRIAQVVLQGRIDAGLHHAGAGDGGGLATLVVHLSRALGRRPEIDHVVTITRAFAEEHARASHEPVAAGASIARIPFGPPGYLATAEMWEHRLEAERSLERTLRALLPLDIVHLRFADVGTLAAARVCRRLGIPVCFTLAADPHVVIRTAERSGALTRESFPEANRRDHYLFRAHLVETMLHQADGLVAFPRRDAEADLQELLGIDASAGRGPRLRTVSEGVSLRTLDRAALSRRTGVEPAVLADLAGAVEALPAQRRGLSVILSVGRFHRIKGFPRLLEAWAGDPALHGSFNLAVVGGNLAHPTAEEQVVLQALGEVARRHPQARDGLLLLGHRPHEDVARLLHAARSGVPGAVAPGGVYACASDKEEFGLALLEALGVGLPVVAPSVGGPPTYVEDGSTGALVDTTSIEDLRRGLHVAAELRRDHARPARATALVQRRFSVDAMAAELASLYADLAPAGPLEAAA